MRHGLSLVVLVALLLVGSVAVSAQSFEVTGSYLFGSYDFSYPGFGVTGKVSGFGFGASTNLTDLIGAKFAYQTGSLTDLEDEDGDTYSDMDLSTMEITGSYRVLATDKYTVSAVAGWKSVDNDGDNGSGFVIGGQAVAPVSDTVAVRGSFYYLPSFKYDGESTTLKGTKLDISAAFTLPQLPCQVEAGYKVETYKEDTYDSKEKIGGLYVGARASF